MRSDLAIDIKSVTGDGSSVQHSQLVNDVLLRIGSRTDVRLWKNHTGQARSADGRRRLTFGIKGGSDLIGLIAPSGRLLAIECKTGKAKQSKEQKAFQAMVEKFGGVYVLARSVEDAVRGLPKT